MAIITRWRIPPDSSCGYWRMRRSGSAIWTRRRASMASFFAALPFKPRWTRTASAICSPTVKTGFRLVIGS